MAARSARWARIPEQVICDTRVSDTDLRIYAALSLALHGRAYAAVPYTTISQLARRSFSTARRSLDRLVATGYVIDLGGDPGGAKEWQLTAFEDARLPGVPDPPYPAHSYEQGSAHLGEQGSALSSEQGSALSSEQGSAHSYEQGRDSRAISGDTLLTAMNREGVHPSEQGSAHLGEHRYREEIKDHSFEVLSGETPEPPIPARPPAVIPWAMLSDILPAQWLRADAGLRSLAQSIELDVIRNPDHPWFGSRLLRSPETIGGWKLEPDPEYWRV